VRLQRPKFDYDMHIRDAQLRGNRASPVQQWTPRSARCGARNGERGIPPPKSLTLGDSIVGIVVLCRLDPCWALRLLNLSDYAGMASFVPG
jgi:hypothetical protein